MIRTINYNKTSLCLLLISLFACFFFAHSVAVREPYIASTFMHQQNYYQRHLDVTATHLGFVNNWLQEGAFQLNFRLYLYPASVEMPTLDSRGLYASYPAGTAVPIYLLFKALDWAGIFPDIYESRGTQLLLLTLYNYARHLLLALTLCFLLFCMCLRLGFDRLNSLLLALIPAMVQFNNATSLYHHHAFYNMDAAIILPFALYALLEFLRTFSLSPRIARTCKVLQPLLMFYGVLTDWLFVFVAITVYATRLACRETALPVAKRTLLPQMKQALLFFAPALAAIAVWIFQIASTNLASTPVSAEGLTLIDILVERMGIAEVVDNYLWYLKTSFITHIKNGYGASGLVIIFATFYLATRGRKFMKNRDDSIKQAIVLYLILLVPCIVYNFIFIQHSHVHIFSALKFSLALSFAFVLLPIFVLQITHKNHLLPALQIVNSTRSITWVTIVALSASLLYGYAQIHAKHSVTKMFAKPDYRHVLVGDFVKQNSGYRDVVFSDFYCLHPRYNTITAHFTHKVIHCANNIDDIYHRTKNIAEDFSIKILYRFADRQEADKLTDFLNSNNTLVNNIQGKGLGLLAFDGKKFISWYEHIHACHAHPDRCSVQRN